MHTHTWYKVITQKYSTGTNDGREITLFKKELHGLLFGMIEIHRNLKLYNVSNITNRKCGIDMMVFYTLI